MRRDRVLNRANAPSRGQRTQGRLRLSTQLMNQEAENNSYQRDLAESLVAVLGFNGAVRACQNNGWEGVLTVLVAKRPAARGEITGPDSERRQGGVWRAGETSQFSGALTPS